MRKLAQIILATLPLFAFAADGDGIGSAEDVSGTSTIDSVPLANGSALAVGDRIDVGPASSSSFRLTNGYIFSLGENSSLQALSYVFSPSGATPNASRFNITEGSVRVVPSAQNPGELVMVTPLGEVLSSSGAFAIVICGANCTGRKGVFVSILSGSVVITNRSGVVVGENGQTFFLGSFETTPQLLTDVPAFVTTAIGAFPALPSPGGGIGGNPVDSIVLDFLAGVCEVSVSPSQPPAICDR